MNKRINYDRLKGGPITAAVLMALGISHGALAASSVSSVELVAGSGGTLSLLNIDNDLNAIGLTKSFTEFAPVTLRITVAHESGGGGNKFSFTEQIINGSGVKWDDYHLSIIEPVSTNGVGFFSFQSSTLGGFDLVGPPTSGPRNLDFVGSLAIGADALARFDISLPDPGQGNTYTFDLVQAPSAIPVPAAVYLLGSALGGLLHLRRKAVRS